MAVPTIVGNYVNLRPINPTDYGLLFAAETGPELGDRWRQRGQTPSYETFVANLFRGVLCQHMICSDAGEPIGYATLYDAVLDQGYAHFAIASLEPTKRTTLVMQGAGIFLHYVFRLWPLRKIYATVFDYNLNQLGSGLGQIFHEEGRLKDYEYWNGRYHDQIILAIYRSDVDRMVARYGQMFGIPFSGEDS